MSVTDGSSVNFSASSAFSLLTKTEYSGGYVKDGDYERINWLSGDGLTVLSPQAELYNKESNPWTVYSTSSSPRYSVAHYTVAGEITPEGIYSTAGVAPFDDKDLHWGEGSHLFFGVYPRLCTLPSSVQGHVGIETDATRTKGIISAYIPGDQVPRSSNPSKAAGKSVRSSSVDSTYIYPQMEYAWMYSAQYAPKAEEDVKMLFSPMVTTFQIAVTGTGDEEVELTRFELESESDALQGSFTATVWVEGGNTVITRENVRTKMLCDLDVEAPSSGDNMKVTFTFPSGTKVSGSRKVTLTVFVFPEGAYDTGTLSNLTIRFVSPGTTRSLKLKDSSNGWVQFPAGRKINIDGLTLPRQEDPWTFTVTGEDWEEELSDIVINPVQITEHENQEGGNLDDRAYVLDVDWESLTLDEGGGARPDFALVKSYKDNADKTPVAYQLEYYDGTQWKAWDSNAPAWLSIPSPASGYAGSYTGDALGLTMAAQVNSAADAHRSAMIAKGSYSTAFDLSTRNVATGETVSMTTANSYVADRPGKYKLPLVYGNGVKDGSPNPDAYSQSLTTAEGFLTTFLDHKDNPITSPYIATQHSGKTLTPVIIWTDAPGLVTDLSITGSGTNAYLNFTVPAENITQGNALVGVTIDGEIAWSWHIWVTEEDLTVLSEVGAGNRMPRVNLGWCETISKTYAARSCSLRVVQPVTGQIAGPVVAGQSAANYPIRENNPYYQWGRKDPLMPAFRKKGSTYYPSVAAYTPQHGVAQRVSIGTAIQTPYIFYSYDATDPADRDWCTTVYVNRWNSHWTGTVTEPSVTKTVYDPSPVGFQMPMRNFYYDGSASVVKSNSIVKINDLVFPFSGYRYQGDITTNHAAYWTAEPDPDRSPTYSWMFYVNVSQWWPATGGSSLMANAIRPVVVPKETFVLDLSVEGGTYNSNTRTVTFQNSFSVDVRSYKAFMNGQQQNVPWTAVFSIDNGQTWSDEPPVWFSDFSSSGPGSTRVDMNIPNNPLKSSKSWLGSTSEVASTATAAIDLSLQNIYGNAWPRTTANCYVVSAPGWYKIPCVYGNAITQGSPNEVSYSGFFRHDGNEITAPWIRDNGITLANAIVCWQDVDELISTSGNRAPYVEGDYVYFYVDPDTIFQGNALLAVRTTAGDIAWSWHIWVTEGISARTNLQTKKVYSHSSVNVSLTRPNRMLNVNLGWCDAETLTAPARSVMVKFIQAGTGSTKTITCVQPQRGPVVSYGTQTFYEHGRKDPMLPTNGVVQAAAGVEARGNKEQFPTGGDYLFREREESGSLSDAVANPNVYFGSVGGLWANWCTQDYYNLWDKSLQTAAVESKVIKTVYDPCPPGFHVPNNNAFTGFSKTGATTRVQAEFNYTGVDNWANERGLWYYCDPEGIEGSPGESLIFIPFTGYRYYQNRLYVGGQGYYWKACRGSIAAQGALDVFVTNKIDLSTFNGCHTCNSMRPCTAEWY